MSKNKKTLTSQEIKELKKILRLNPNFSVQGKLGDFFDYYLLCEVTARKLIYYKKKKNNTILYISSIISAMKHFFPNNYKSVPVNEIFASGSNTHRNNKTCRQLRNNYIHTLSKEDKTEIENRNSDLKSNMRKWLYLFENL